MPAINGLTLARLVSSKRNFKIYESRCVADVDYDLESQTLKIAFQKRGTYEYYNVPLDDFVDFADSSSQGRYFNLYIREKFSYQRIA